MTARLESLDAYIAEHRERWMSELIAFCRYPSVADYPEAMHAAADWLVRRLTETGLSARLLPNPAGFPTVFAERAGRSPRRLLFYNHYDIAAYTSPLVAAGGVLPATLRDGRLYNRGVADDKGCCFSRIAAVEALLRTAGELPVGVAFLIFGKRKPNDEVLDDVLARYPRETAGDGVVWETGAKDDRDRPTASLGAKGYVYVEMLTRALRSPQPSRFTILPSAAWDLVWALASLKDSSERVLVDGFYADVMEPSEEDLAAVDDIGTSLGPEMLERTGARAFLLGETGPDAARRWFFEPSCTICGVASGYTGPGERLVLPDQASAKVEFRLVARQDPHDIVRKVRAHLDRRGFERIEMTVLSHTAPYRTPVSDPLVRAAQRAARRVYGQELVLRPTSIGMSPKYKFAPRPTVGLGVEYAGSQLEEPDEHIRVADWIEGTKLIAALLEEYAR